MLTLALFSNELAFIRSGSHSIEPNQEGDVHTAAAFSNLPAGSLPAATAKKIHFSGTGVFHIRNGKVTEELGPEQALTALQHRQAVNNLKWNVTGAGGGSSDHLLLED
jgi:hypothetical protein